MRENDFGNLPRLYDIVHGEVASFQSYGAFIRIPGCRKQGLLHISQMSNGRVDDPADMLAKGERIYCKVISMERNGERISLSMKVVSQSNGKDLDPNNVQSSQEEKKRRQWNNRGSRRIELGAELNTTCRRCGGHGHLAMDCYSTRGDMQYDLLPDFDQHEVDDERSHRKHKKKEKKSKKQKKTKKEKSSSESEDSTSSDEDRRKKSTSSNEDRRKKSTKVPETGYSSKMVKPRQETETDSSPERETFVKRTDHRQDYHSSNERFQDKNRYESGNDRYQERSRYGKVENRYGNVESGNDRYQDKSGYKKFESGNERFQEKSRYGKSETSYERFPENSRYGKTGSGNERFQENSRYGKSEAGNERFQEKSRYGKTESGSERFQEKGRYDKEESRREKIDSRRKPETSDSESGSDTDSADHRKLAGNNQRYQTSSSSTSNLRQQSGSKEMMNEKKRGRERETEESYERNIPRKGYDSVSEVPRRTEYRNDDAKKRNRSESSSDDERLRLKKSRISKEKNDPAGFREEDTERFDYSETKDRKVSAPRRDRERAQLND